MSNNILTLNAATLCIFLMPEYRFMHLLRMKDLQYQHRPPGSFHFNHHVSFSVIYVELIHHDYFKFNYLKTTFHLL